MFKGKAWKWLLLGSACTVLLLYMLELTTTGIERVNGPLQVEREYTLQPNPAYTGNESQAIFEDDELAFLPPIDPNASPLEQEITALEYEIALLKKQALEQEREKLKTELLVNEAAGQPAVNRFADKTSGVLQEASASGLKYVAQLFNKVIN